MAEVLLDTNVVSYRLKGHSLASDYSRIIRDFTPVICFMTVGELHEGAWRRRWSDARIAHLILEIQDYLILPYSLAMCEIWGRIRAQRRSQPIAVDDAWIAAAALAYGIPLATHNPSDFKDIAGLSILTSLNS